jgi:transketolase
LKRSGKLFRRLRGGNPELAAEFERTQKGERKAGWEKAIPSFPVGKPVATRNAGGAVMNAIADVVPELFGGAADLTRRPRRSSSRARASMWIRRGAMSSSGCASLACARR